MTTLPENKKYSVDGEATAQAELAENVFSLTVAAPAIAQTAQPGQFVQLSIMEPSLTLRRPVGVAAVDKKRGTCTFIYRQVGRGTAALAELLPGEIVGVLGPLGHGFGRDYVHPLLVGGGMGLSPLLFVAAAYAGQADVLMGGKTADELFWTELYAPHVGQTFLTTDDGSLGRQGFTTTLLPEILEAADGAYDAVLVCGPEIMMRGVAQIAAAHGVPCEVSLEKRMACGLGACLSCSIDTAHGRRKVCKDGPVFPAEEVFL